MSQLHGESAEVSQEAVEQWMTRLPKICKGYALRGIYNCDAGCQAIGHLKNIGL